MSFVKRLVNVGKGWVSTQLGDHEEPPDEAVREELRQAERALAARARGARSQEAGRLADAARSASEAARVIADTPEPQAPELDELGLPRPKSRSL